MQEIPLNMPTSTVPTGNRTFMLSEDCRSQIEEVNYVGKTGTNEKDLERMKKRENEYRQRVKEMERKYLEMEKTEIQEIVHAAGLSPEALSRLIRQASESVPDADFFKQLQESDKENEEVSNDRKDSSREENN